MLANRTLAADRARRQDLLDRLVAAQVTHCGAHGFATWHLKEIHRIIDIVVGQPTESGTTSVDHLKKHG